MKQITEEDLKTIDSELLNARNRFEKTTFNSLEEKLEWIKKFFNEYVPTLEKRFLTEEEMNDWVFLPNELRVKFYLYFPEHGLNMANYSQELAKENSQIKRLQLVNRAINRSYFRHYD